ncbi:hypothetical protein H257_01107 [Aphanomyces astaci]|uniref:Thymidine kinase n=1 Tax=Aphanomyces astaci TaxID=112090 RepID=W4H7Q4_APHAT|nr:hypothetical protein H257_01107 [Aphanomyces astaci]ETV87581.1 hypothetical protein H257_01107 [Aphanomyces astaci]|eukprot:XP_009822444.1 hypothetical protein H257_01107 [Aphanomyces astaci]
MPIRSIWRHALQGELQLIIGPMFSGKSTELIRRMRRYQHAQLKCMVVKSKIDDRYTNDSLVSTHDRQMMKANPLTRLEDMGDEFMKYDVIGIDEGQFFTDLHSFCDDAANRGKIVIVAALDGTFERKPFQHVCDLIPRAESVTKLSAVCAICGSDAAFTRRLVSSTAVELVGGSESYQPVCRNCFTTPLVTGEEEQVN